MLKFAQNHRRALRTFGWTFLALGFAGVTFFLSSTHRSRLALESYQPVEAASLYAAQSAAQSASQNATPWNSEERIASSIGEVKAILEPFNQIKRRYDLPIVQSDSPDECLKAFETGLVMDCAGMALSAVTKLKEYDVESRIWYLTGTDGFGGNGHNVIEYFNTASSRWEMLDPNYSCYMTRKGDETVLSVAEVREALLTKSDDLEVRYYKSAVELRSPESLLEEFRSLTPSASLLATTDHRERYLNRYALLMPMAGLLDQLPLTAKRGIRSFLMGVSDQKLLLDDRFTPRYHLTLYTSLWYLSLAMLVLGCSLISVWAMSAPSLVQFRVKLFAQLHGLQPRTLDDRSYDQPSASPRGLPAQSGEVSINSKARYAKI